MLVGKTLWPWFDDDVITLVPTDRGTVPYQRSSFLLKDSLPSIGIIFIELFSLLKGTVAPDFPGPFWCVWIGVDWNKRTSTTDFLIF